MKLLRKNRQSRNGTKEVNRPSATTRRRRMNLFDEQHRYAREVSGLPGTEYILAFEFRGQRFYTKQTPADRFLGSKCIAETLDEIKNLIVPCRKKELEVLNNKTNPLSSWMWPEKQNAD